MPVSRTIWLDEETYNALLRLKFRKSMEEGRVVTFSELIRQLLRREEGEAGDERGGELRG